MLAVFEFLASSVTVIVSVHDCWGAKPEVTGVPLKAISTLQLAVLLSYQLTTKTSPTYKAPFAM